MIPDNDILGFPKNNLIGTPNSDATEQIKFEKKIETGKSTYQNQHFDESDVWLKVDNLTLGASIFMVLLAFYNENWIGLIIGAVFLISINLIGNTAVFFLKEVIVDYDSKKITFYFKRYKKELEKVEFNFDEIIVSTYRSKGQGFFLQISEDDKVVSFMEGKLGLEPLGFNRLKTELNQIEHQNSAWWQNMKEVFPKIP